LPKDRHIIIEDYEKTFGREDFLGVLLPDDLVFIGKEHFKITRMDDGFYIEDLDTKNGTTINGNEIKGSGKIKLENRDEILVAKTLPIKYLENKMS
jgi:pSer/pThr/pTyr-binding forkhead associated (FHA) protein